MKKISIITKKNIINSLLEGISTREIAIKYNVSQSKVSQIAKEIKGDIPKVKMGRPSRVSDQTKRYLVQGIITSKFKTAVEATKVLKENLQVELSASRVKQILNENGLKGVIKKKKPFLSLKHQKARMEFVKKYENWTEDDWRRVVWSDETKINFFGSDGVKWGWKKGNQSYDPRILSPTVKHGGGNIMIWGCMTWDGPGLVNKIEGKMDTALYIKIIDECLPNTLEKYHINKNEFIFQQDNDPKHTSKAAKKYFEEKKIDILFWPAQSPDLNPIEHLWVHIKRELAKYPEPPKGCNMLWERVKEVYNSIPKEVCQNLIKSMPSRIQAVKKAKGGHTKY